MQRRTSSDDARAGAPPAPQQERSPPTTLPPPRDLGPHKDDPDGVAPASEAKQDEPKGLPNSDRHAMETTVAKRPSDAGG